jgi:hypothetical protein
MTHTKRSPSLTSSQPAETLLSIFHPLLLPFSFFFFSFPGGSGAPASCLPHLLPHPYFHLQHLHAYKLRFVESREEENSDQKHAYWKRIIDFDHQLPTPPPGLRENSW